MSNLNLEQLRTMPAATAGEIAAIRNRLETQRPQFVFDEEYLACLAFGGTIQSAYIPTNENILPVPMNPGLERLAELSARYGIANKRGGGVTGAILNVKDSRQLINADVVSLVHTIQQIPNKKILVSCGTYMLPLIGQALDFSFGQGKSNKIIGLTGSWLPFAIESSDADFNLGGVIASINAYAAINKTGIVFAHFHGNISVGADMAKLDLHLPGINPKLAFPAVETR